MSLKVEALAVARGRRRVLDDVSLSIAAGEIIVVVGANGAGKTTLFDAIAGAIPSRGRVTWAGSPLRTIGERARVMSYLRDDAEPPAEVSVAALIAHARHHGGATPALAAELESALGLSPLRRARAGELSRGERKRLQLFAALCTTRPLLLLDEPLGTFDPLQLISVLELLRGRAAAGAAMLVSVHQMSDAEKLAARILLLDGGRARACGTLAELRENTALPGAPLEAVVIELLRRARAAA